MVSHQLMECRSGCAACCIAPSISSAIPGLPEGKPAGMPCLQLTLDKRCRIFGRPERPAVCAPALKCAAPAPTKLCKSWPSGNWQRGLSRQSALKMNRIAICGLEADTSLVVSVEA